ncbi:MAG: phenylacetate--CoA ligase family protein [Williamsia herbipolensis]|nr:phenylacetate--CoA ligase family protein [Williamsia herbipolensis]
MAPRGAGVDVKHRLRRAHPYRSIARRQLAWAEQATPAELADRRDRRLRAQVRWAARRSPFYREMFAEHGIDPRDIRTAADLVHLPTTDRVSVTDRRADFCALPERLMWPASSSGTSGRPVTVMRTPASSVYELCAQERQWRWFGLDADTPRIVLRGNDFVADTDGSPVRPLPGNRQLMVSSFYLTPDHLPAILGAVDDFGPQAIEGWPSSIAVLAGLLADAGHTLPLRGVITSSEVIGGPARALMASVFDAPIVDHYGQTERVVMTGNCEHGTHHVFDDYGVLEQVPVPGVPDRWEIVGTSLHNRGFPLLRYRTGDQVGPAPDEPCPCGRPFGRIGTIAGRAEDVFTAADGRALPVPSTVVDDLVGVRGVQIVQHRAGDFEVRVVPGGGWDAEVTDRQVRRNVDRMFGPGQRVTITTLDTLSTPDGGKVKSAYVVGV